MARIGFGLGYDPALNVNDMVALMQRAEDRGFELGFFSETIELMRDSVTTLTAIGAATTRLRLGCTQIVRLRTPIIMAQTLATLDELTRGRMILSPGACTTSHMTVHSLETIDPVLTLTEWTEAIRLLVSGEKVTYRGKVVQLDGIGMAWPPYRKHIPLWLAATSRTGLRLAGRIADGVVLNATASPDYTANAIRILKESVEEAGRDWSQFEIAQLIVCSVEDDHEKALDEIRWEVASKFDPVQLPFNAGPRMRVGEPYIKKEDIPTFQEAYRQGGMPALMKALPRSYVEGLTASGTPDEVLKRVQQYRDVGVRLPILRPAARHQAQRLIDLFAQ